MMTLAYYNEIEPSAAEWLRELIKAGEIAPGDVDERSICDVEAKDLRGYTQCHFFAGISVWSAALRLAGWEDTRPCWTGSAPCQPYSVAGKQRGHEDERDLWGEYFRLLRDGRPEIAFGEQVSPADVVGSQLEAAFLEAVQADDYARANKLAKQLTQANGFHYHPRWIDRLRADMEGINYTVGHIVLGAHSAGADHIRQRLWWVGKSTDKRHERAQGPRGRRDDAEYDGAGGADGGLADVREPGLEARQRCTELEAEDMSTQRRCDFDLWRASRWHQCRDGKQRRVPSVRVDFSEGLRRSERQDESGSERARTGAGESRQSTGDGCVHVGQADDTPPTQPRFQLVADAGAAPCSAANADGEWDGSFFPLAPKTEGRVMILKGAGNAICLGTAAAFIQAAEG